MKQNTILWVVILGIVAYIVFSKKLKADTSLSGRRNTQTAARPPTIFDGLLNVVPVNTQQDLGKVISGGGQAVASIVNSISQWFKPSSQTAGPSSVATDTGNILNDRFVQAWQSDLPSENYSWDNSSDYQFQ